jgi:large subunit ribosomal protein L21
MKFAAIKTGGKQYLVHEGMVLKVEKITGSNPGAKVSFDTLATVEGESVSLGKPLISSKVQAEVVSVGRNEKVTVLRYMPKSRWAKKNGHKQPFTEVKILSV